MSCWQRLIGTERADFPSFRVAVWIYPTSQRILNNGDYSITIITLQTLRVVTKPAYECYIQGIGGNTAAAVGVGHTPAVTPFLRFGKHGFSRRS